MKILMIALGPVAKTMSGPQIRSHEIAQELSKQHEVVLAVPNTPDFNPKGYRFESHTKIRSLIRWADVVISQPLPLRWLGWMALYKPFHILDAYDPLPLENLEKFKIAPLKQQSLKQIKDVELMKYCLSGADGVMYASASQKDLWIGFWLSLGRVSPARYQIDPTFNTWMAFVPFGVQSEPISKHRELREKYKLKETDTLLIWGGGIWNWFDPLTLIQAVYELNQEGVVVKLLYMGSSPPGKEKSQNIMEKKAIELAMKLEVLDQSVFFNPGWVPYEKRGAYLSSADIGVSCHFNHLETRYSFRTRVLDYLWASIPMILTEGDFFGELIHKEGAGIKVGYQDVSGVKAAILKIRNNPEPYKVQSKALSQKFLWSECVKPLYTLLDSFENEKPKGYSLFKALSLKARLCLGDLL